MLARGLELLVVLLLLVVLVLLLLVHGLLRGGLVVLLGSSGGREGGDVGLEVGELSRLWWRRLVDGVCFARALVLFVVEKKEVPRWETLVALV